MTELAVLTPVKKHKGEELRAYLRKKIDRDAFTAKRTKKPAHATHFARLVVIEVDGQPHLLFTSRFDGGTSEYLRELVKQPEAKTIWGYCEEPRSADEESLFAHLLSRDARLAASYVVARVPQASDTVERINAALELQARLARFASNAERLSAVELAHEFWQLDAVQEILER